MDIYVNVAGGIRIDEVGIDLALAMALYSARTNLSLPALSAVLGEVSLAGEIRGVTHIERRVKSARDMGFQRIIGPTAPEVGRDARQRSKAYSEVRDLKEAVRIGFGR